MLASLFRIRQTISLIGLGCCLSTVEAQEPASAIENPAPPVVANQTAAALLDAVSNHTKARWRLLFRGPPPTPPADRARAALILGTLIGDSYLVLQAGDAQQFRNNNQDVLAYCRTLGLGEKLTPRLMTQGNLAEQTAWKELRQELVDGHQEALRLLREQKDEDLALLIDIGVGLRLLEIVSAIIISAPESDMGPLGRDSPTLLRNLRKDFSLISAEKRALPLLTRVCAVIDEACASRQNLDKTVITQGQAVKTNEQLKELMQELITK
jgi:hypothetical protein